MDITAFGGKFAVAMTRLGAWKYEWNKDGTLSIWGDHALPITVTTNRGEFIEAVDADGEIVCEGGDGQWFYVPVAKRKTVLRFRQLPDPSLSPADINKARQTVTRYLLSDRPYNCKLPDTVAGVIKWMQKKLAEIPKECRAKASFTFDTTMEYGENYPNIEITYCQPETDAEVVRRVQIGRERARIKDTAERAQFRKLKSDLHYAARRASQQASLSRGVSRQGPPVIPRSD